MAAEKAQAFYRYLLAEIIPERGFPKTVHELINSYEEYRALAPPQTLLSWQRLYSALVNILNLVECTQGVLYWAEDRLAGEGLSSQTHRGYGAQPLTQESVLQGPRWEGRLGPSVKTFQCTLCGVSCGTSVRNFQQHLDGRKHAENERQRDLVDTPRIVDSAASLQHPVVSMPPPQTRFRAYCPQCEVTCWTAGAWNAHLSLPPHNQSFDNGATAVNGPTAVSAPPAGNAAEKPVLVYYCKVCDKQLTAENAATHKYGKHHKAALAAQARLASGLGSGFAQPAGQLLLESNAALKASPRVEPRFRESQQLEQPARPAGLPNQDLGLGVNPQPRRSSAAKKVAVELDIVPGSRSDFELCTLCGREVHRASMGEHVRGRRHREVLRRREKWLADSKGWNDVALTCHVCRRDFKNTNGVRNHQSSESHQRAYQSLQLTNQETPPGAKRQRGELSASGDAPLGAKRKRGESPANGGAPPGEQRTRKELQGAGPADPAALPVDKRKRVLEEESDAMDVEVEMSSEEWQRKKRRMERFGDGKVTGATGHFPAPGVTYPDVQVSRPAEDTGKQTKKFTVIRWTPAADVGKPSLEKRALPKQVSKRTKVADGRSAGEADGVEKRVSRSGKPSMGVAPVLNGASGGNQRERGSSDRETRLRGRGDGTASNRQASGRDLREGLASKPANGLPKPSAGGQDPRGLETKSTQALRMTSKHDVSNGRSGVQSRGSVTVSRPFLSKNKPRSAAPETEFADVVTIRNGGGAAVSLLGCGITPPSGVFSLVGVSSAGGTNTRAEFPLRISGGGGSLSLALLCKAPPDVGVVSARLELRIEGFRVLRDLRVFVEDTEIRALRPREQYRPPRVTPKQSALPIVTDPSLPRACLTRFARECLKPCVFQEAVEKGVSGGEELAELAAPLDVENYAAKMTALYHLEAMQLEVDIRAYDIPSVMLTSSRGEYLELHVPGLAERRPSVGLGDRVYLTPTRFLEGGDGRQSRGGMPCEFEVFVHAVKPDSERIYIKSPRLDDRTQYRVRFSPNPETLTHAQHALRLISQDAAFPPLAPLVLPFELPSVLEETDPPEFDRKDVQLNDEQAEAVSQILLRTRLRGEIELDEPLPPYVVFGPPGTGKTKTLVEAVFQVLKADPNASILACAPSNGAADNLLERLKELGASDLIRINAFHRLNEGPGALPAHLEKFARYDSRDTHSYTVPPVRDLRHARVIVTTCSSSALLWRAGLDRGEFSHIFIDEAGHATEPETFIPLGCFAAPDTVIVLAGDHQQLGPTVRSPLARDGGFGVSYLERLFLLPFYNPEAEARFVGFREPVITKLLKNYRSHPLILQLPWRMFYQDDLLAVADKIQRESLCQLPHLPKRGFPIIFEGVEGLDEREGDSPSWFNAIELRKVLAHLNKLRSSRLPPIEMKTVGVITQFRRQCEKAKKLFEGQGFGAVKVGTVEEFQGQEMRVIIVSTVRSSLEHVEFDKQHGLGFLGQPKRFNVAVTRAKELLIIVGNPHVLAQDEYWGKMLRYCVEKGGYTGCPLPRPEDSPEEHPPDVASLGEYIPLGEEDVVEDGAENGTGNEDGDEALLSRTRPSHVALYEEPAWPGAE